MNAASEERQQKGESGNRRSEKEWTDLRHEPRDHTMEMQPIIKPSLCKIKEIRSSARHLVKEDLSGEDSSRRVKVRGWIRKPELVMS
jgi:hypothetical protein